MQRTRTPKRQKEKEKIRQLIDGLKSGEIWKPIEILEAIYQISAYFCKYHKGYKRKCEEAVVELQKGPKGKYYTLWRMIRAISIAESLKVYKSLTISMPLKDIRGESFYSGIPSIMQEEVDWAEKVNKEILTVRKRFLGLKEKVADEKDENAFYFWAGDCKIYKEIMGPDGKPMGYDKANMLYWDEEAEKWEY